MNKRKKEFSNNDKNVQSKNISYKVRKHENVRGSRFILGSTTHFVIGDLNMPHLTAEEGREERSNHF